jgi:KUP system potassium uptake protein
MSSGSSPRALAALAALGIVYGDIGTSPLYAFKESFHEGHGLAVSEASVFGILSLIFWSLLIIITIKYLVFILRADNKGEGGILALTVLIQKALKDAPRTLQALTLLGLFGTALLYGDGVITPAISVLSAVEGLELVAPQLHPYILPITVAILVALFSIQRHGTHIVGRVFGPVTLSWFITLGTLGVMHIWDDPSVLQAMNPFYAWQFFSTHGMTGFAVLGSVFLVVTGGEALYSDLGHFGRAPIRLAWGAVVLPALVLNYFGQGALILAHPAAVKNPFYYLAPSWALVPLIILATASTVIASQALITGVFSLTAQAVQLQYFPRLHISHTSRHEVGQIYVGSVNFCLMLACIAVVLMFKTSSQLAAAYGIAVTTTMVITTVLFYFVAVHAWGWKAWWAFALCAFFLVIEGAFWGANLLKIAQGGWLPLGIGVLLYTIMTTWKTGRQILALRMREHIITREEFLHKLKHETPQRVSGTAIYMSGHPDYIPATLVQSYRHYHCLHERVAFLNVRTSGRPFVPFSERVSVEEVAPTIFQISVVYGFMDIPNIPVTLTGVKLAGVEVHPLEATYFLGREHLISTKREGMMIWRERLFALMSRNAQPATRFYRLPAGRVVEMGSIIEL